LINTSYKRIGNAIDASITLPDGLAGVLVWHGTEHPLHAGLQELHLK
jgi:hypothetical protein